MDKTQCPHCERNCVPKLWHYRPAFGALRYMATQHLCPFCGGVMYQSGGQLTLFGWLVVVAASTIFGIGFIAQLFKSQDITEVFIGLGSLVFWGFIVYLLYKRFSGRRR